MIELIDLSVRYIGRRAPALKNVSLRINPGETLLLLGASGCGKSTLALCLNGLIPHSVGVELGGQVRVDGLDTCHTAVAALAQKVGIVFQDPEAQFVTLKVEDEIVFGLENLRRPPESMSATVGRALAEVGMPAARERAPHLLSGGEKQRIALAALLAMEPGVVVFDEPTANLDPVGTQSVFALLAELKARARHTLVLIEHKLDDLMNLIDRVVVLGPQGAVVADGDPRTVFYQQAEQLRAHGVWTPQVVQLAQALRAQGCELAGAPLTLEDAEAALRQTAFSPPPPLGLYALRR